MRTLTGGEAICEALVSLGVGHVFGIVSVHNIPIYDALLRHGGITMVPCRHEQGAVHAADGYARATGKLGVAIVSTGPGTTNAMSGLYEAAFASSRVLLITGQVETRFYGKGKGFLHEAERQVPMLQSVCRRVESPRRPEDIASAIVRVATDINTGRPQPGAVEIPIDLQYANAQVELPYVEGWPRIDPPGDQLEEAARLLAAASRRIIWAGGGVTNSGASGELQQLAETLNAPVFTSANGRGAIPEDHPLALGPVTGDPAMQAVLDEAEVVLAVGTRFQAGATRNWSLKLPGQLIHLDADPGVIGRNFQPDLAIIGDARLGLTSIARALPRELPHDEAFVGHAVFARDEIRTGIRTQIGPDYEAIMDAMRDSLPRDGIVVRDSTVPAYIWGNRLFPIYEPRTSIHPTSAAIGPGLPLAIGAAIGSGRPTALIQGDGGLMLSLGELATLAASKAPVVVCVFNDRGYGVLRSIQARTFEGRQTGVDLTTPDFAAVATAMGVPGERVSSAAELSHAFRHAIESGGPALLDIDMTTLAPMAGFGVPLPRREAPWPARTKAAP